MDDQEAAQAAEAWLADPVPQPLAPGAQAQVNLNAAKASGQTPDFAAESRRLAAEIGVPEYTAQQAPDAVRQRSFEMGLTGLTIAAPKTTRFLGDPGKAAIVADSIDNLVAVEHAAGAPILYFETDKGRAEARVTPDGKTYFDGQDFTGAANSFKFVRPVYGSAGAQQTGTPGAFVRPTGLGDSQALQNLLVVPRGVASAWPAYKQGVYGASAALAGVLGWDEGQDTWLAMAGKARAEVPAVAGPANGWFARQVQGASQSLGLAIPGLAATVLTDGAAAPLFFGGYVGGVTQGGQSAQAALEAGKTPAQALAYGAQDATWEIALGAIPEWKLVKDLKVGSPFVKTLLGQLTTEVPTEVATTILQNWDEWQTLHPEKTFETFVSEQPTAIQDTIAQTVLMAGGMASLATVGKAVATRQREAQLRAQQAGATAKRLETLDKLAVASPLRERDPKAFEEFVASVVQDGGDSVYVDAKTFAQAAQDAPPEEQAILQGMASMQGLAEAAATGQDLKVPVAEFAARLAGTSLGKAIIENGRSNPFELSRAQAAEAQATQGDALQAEAAKVLASAQADDAFRASAKVVEEQTLGQLTAVNRFSPDVNKAYAKAHAAFYAVQAARHNTTPEEMAQRYPLRITAQEAPGSNPLRQNLPTLKAPPTSPSGKVRLLHWGKKGKVARLDPKKWGGNQDVLSRAERMMADDDRHPGRVYFGIGVGQPGGYTPEFGLGEHLYGAEIDAKDLYDYDADPLGLRAGRVKEMLADEGFDAEPEEGMPDFGYYDEAALLYDLAIREAGYKGFWTAEQGSGLIGVSFEKVRAEYQGKNDGQAFYQRAVAKGDGRRFRDFFAGVTSGASGRPDKANDQRLVDLSEVADFSAEYNKHLGNFDKHIEASIPTFREVQHAVGAALVKALPDGSSMLDIAGSEGALAKAISAVSKGGIETVVLDPNQSMRETFANTSQVPGATFVMDAFTDTAADEGQTLWTEPALKGDGEIEIKGYTPSKPFTVVHEAMGFQFIHNDREAQVSRVKELLEEGGLAVFEEKFVPGNGLSPEQWKANEAKKDDFKRQFFSEADIAAKAKTVLQGETTDEEKVVGMNDLMVAPGDFENTLRGHFAFVVQFWDSGNFKGYMASDSAEMLSSVLENLIPLDSEFSTVSTPREVGADSGLPLGGTFAQSAPIFYSALARAVENNPTKRASAAQWLATLAKTPGVKQEEIEWTGVGEWLKLQEGQVEREDLSRFLAENGVQLEEVTLGEGRHTEEQVRAHARELLGRLGEFTPDAERVDGMMEEARSELAMYDVNGSPPTQFSSYKLPGADDTYKELLITLPKINGPATHWDVDNVVAHARITERKSADGKRVLFLEEVQSDWHQKGRDQGYQGDASPEEKAAAELALQRASTENGEAQDAYLSLVREAIYAKADELDRLSKEHFFKETGRYPADGEEHPMVDQVAEMRSRVGAGLSIQGAGAYLSRYEVAFTPALTEGLQRYNTSRLRLDEAYLAEAATAGGIPDAPFRKTWSALVMKRMIRYAVDNGFEQIAWINGNQQNGGTTGGDGSFFYERNLVNVTNDLLKRYGTKAEQTVRLKGLNTTSAFAPEFAVAREALAAANEKLRALSVRDPANGEAELTRRAAELRTATPPEILTPENADKARQSYLETAAKLEAGIPAIQQWRDATAAYKATENLPPVYKYAANFGFTITPELATAASAGLPLFQNGEDRGSFDPNTNTINLLRRADLSTFLHETGHFYLNVLADIASRPDAPAEIVSDMDTTLRWFGVPDLATWRAMSLDQQRPHHEKFARGFEAYLFEGKAPSLKMRELFQKFRSWLKNVYQSLTALNVELDDEVRGVFDRMLASADEIKQAEDARAFAPLFATKPEGMTTDEWTEYQRLGQQATADAADELETRSLRDMKWLSNAKSRALKTLQKDALAKRQAVRAEVETEVQAEPVYRAQAYLKKGELDGTPVADARKLSIPALKAANEGVAPELQDWTTLGYGKYGMLAEDGMTPDEAAELFGFDSGGQLVDALLNAEPINDKIKGLTDQRMLERYGDLTDPATLARAAEQAVHNEARIRFVAAELNALAKGLGKPSILNAAVKEYAAGIIARLPIKELRPHRYTAAGLRAAKASEKALAKGNQIEALTEKRNQLINIQAARAAWDARAEVDKGMALFARIARAKDDSVARSRNMDLVNAARAIMAAYGLGRAKNDPAGYMKALKAYDVDLFNDIEPFVTAATANPKPVEQLTYEEFLGLRDTVNQLWTLARRSKVIEIDGKQMEIDAVTAELGQRLDVLGVPDRNTDRAPTDGERRLRQLSGLRAATRRVEHWAQLLGKPFTRYIWNPVSDAADAYRAEKAVYMAKFLDLLKPIAHTLTPVKIAATEIGYTFSGKSELLHAILHTGNLSNKTKLLVGRKWGSLTPDGALNSARWEAFVTRMYDEGVITKADMDFAQSVWNLLEETKPLAQRAHHTMYGRYFAEVTADEVVTPFGTYAGGYVPALTDAFLVQDAALRAEAEAVEGGDHSMFPSPTKGFTQGRVENYNRELALDLRLLPQHIDKVLKFSHLGPPVRDVLRLLKAKGFSSKLEKFDPVAQGELLLPWLNRAVRQTVSTPMKGEAGRMADAFFREVRKRTGLQIMFGNLVNAIQQFTGFSVSLVKVKPTHLRAALWRYMRQPTELAEAIASVSPFMAERMASQTFEINQAIDDIVLDPTKLDQTRAFFNRHGYFLQHAFQNVVDITTWQGAYDQAQADGMQHTEAVREANAVVRQTQGAMNPEDLARVEAGNAVFRLFTQFSTYFNNMANLLGTEFAGTIRDAGFKGTPRLVYVYFTVFAIPALLSDLLVRAMRGEGDDEDDGWMDEFLDWFFGAQFRTLTAMIPVAGPAVQATVNTFNKKPYDDRIANSPALAALESAARAPKSVYAAATGDGSTKRAVKDVLSAVGLATGLPVAVVGKPVGYAIDVAEGKTKPTGPVDAARGAVSGTGPPHF